MTSHFNENELYIILTLSDAKLLANNITINTPELERIKSRFELETGANLLQIVTWLKNMIICPACSIENQEHSCSSLVSRKLGRRLYRLLLRANYIDTGKR